ncbi:kinesin-like protein KIN-14I isoform X2 [Andrographis paniculata]|uniref:kinesin-like protein KIN-14I isoform X2 n=1 Tax=Andrographis paniculata TaxID=175694 RepID=UPI0021E81E05|nr:kinesin-like protein KIN-14I isoform X2 [Andrographis paniculata]
MAEGAVQLNVASAVEDALRQNGNRLSDIDLASRKAEETSFRRYEAAGWLRKMLGEVVEKDLPPQPSEEEFRLSLRSGIILCNVLNKVQPGAVQKVVEAPSDTVIIPDGAALSAFQYFENVRNFLDSAERMGIPAFETSDLEQGGKTFRIVNCVLALKSFHEWKQGGGKGVKKFVRNVKLLAAGKQFVRKNSDLFTSSFSRNSPTCEKFLDCFFNERNSGNLGLDLTEMASSNALHTFVCDLLSDKKPEDIPSIVENLLSRVMEEYERRMASQSEQARTDPGDSDIPSSNKCTELEVIEDECLAEKDDESKEDVPKHQDDAKQQRGSLQAIRSIQELKSTLHSTKNDIEMLSMKYQAEVNNLGKQLYSLAHAASGYQKVLEENRKLYNQVQDLRGNIRVYCRIRPFLPENPPGSSCVEATDEQTLTVLTSSKYVKGKKSFTFNRVFGPSSSQEEVFGDTQPLIRSVLDGYNVCIFAYGQTGSGKTYTMTGPKELTQESLGVNYRALNDLFCISEQRKNTISYDVYVQMIEIYNEQVRDLLVTDGLHKKLEIRNNTSNGINVPDANLLPVTSPSDVINLMNLGHKNRAVGSTAMNDRSSRSHSCLTVHVQGRNLTSGSTLRGCMHLVDLAGSERVDKTEASGDRLKEAQHINRSLSALGDVISSLARKSPHVPYRNSKLTQLLQDSLGGQAKTLMFVHISPEPDAVSETISTLKFAERVSTIELGAARVNKESTDVKELKDEIAALKAALSQKDRGESDFHQCRVMSPDKSMTSPLGTSPSDSFRSNGDDTKTEVISQVSSIPTTQSFDAEILDSPSWPSPKSTEEGKDEWAVDKVVMKKPGGLSGGYNHLEKWEDGGESPKALYQKSSHETSKVYPEQSLKKYHRQHSLDNGLGRIQSDDHSDEQELETSDSSELDYQLQINVPRTIRTPNGAGSKVKRSPLQAKTPEKRSPISQQPARKVSNKGNQSPLRKHAKQPALVDVKRKSAAAGK